MRIWLAYKFRGAPFEDLRETLEILQQDFTHHGHLIVTMLQDIQHWEPIGMSKAQAVREAYALMRTCDVCLCLYDSLEPSEGRGFDAGFFAGCGKPTIMAAPAEMTNPYTEALFAENPANAGCPIPCIIRYQRLADVIKHFIPST